MLMTAFTPTKLRHMRVCVIDEYLDTSLCDLFLSEFHMLSNQYTLRICSMPYIHSSCNRNISSCVFLYKFFYRWYKYICI